MTIVTPLALRWERAQQINRSTIEALGCGWYIVPSSRHATDYAVQITFDAAGQLATAACTCPDFAQRTHHLGTPALHGVRVCKHILAASLKAQEEIP